MNLSTFIWSMSVVAFSGSEPHYIYDVRSSFHDNMESEKVLSEITDMPIGADNAVVLGYQGISDAMLAQYSFFVLTKYIHFKDGKEKIEKAIELEPHNAELRYLRLLVQLNTPGFLGYQQNIEEDIDHFVKHIRFSGLSEEWISTFVNNLLISKNMESKYRKMLTTFVNA